MKELQEFLKSLGFSPGPIDGLDGPKTQAAMQSVREALEREPSKPFDLDVNTRLLIKELERDEGRVLHAYQDSLGYWTIGIGRLIDKRRGGGLSHEEVDYLKVNDIKRVQSELDSRLPWWRDLDEVRQRAIQNMAFQLGTLGLSKFTTSLSHIKAGRWKSAGDNLRKSLWYRQTPNRAERVVKMIETGKV